MHCLRGSSLQLLTPRSLCRLVLGILTLIMFATVVFWIHKTPLDINQALSGVHHVKKEEVTKFVSRAEGDDGVTQGNVVVDNSSSDISFAEEVRVLSQSLRTPKIVLTTTNMGFLDFTENMLLSIDKLNIHPQVVVIAEDTGAYEALRNHKYGLHVLKPPDFHRLPREKKAIDFGVPDYVRFINRRPSYVYEFVKQGFEVFFVDADSYWFRDPYPYFKGGDFDVAFMRDYRKVFNAGVGYYRPTNHTEYFLRLWVWVLETQPKLRQDQFVLNNILSSKICPDLTVRSLGFQTFPTCKILYDWDHDVCRNTTKKTTLFHAAFIAHHVNKRRVFERCNIWLLKNNTRPKPPK